ncbi:hypothetical protein [Cryptosporangium sp. NPDC051539]|uniref:hypothetical protein n=1 Tax=Cryptosporangium sp. NPDC051539 TaxID=3363962 RepID=UPI003792D413
MGASARGLISLALLVVSVLVLGCVVRSLYGFTQRDDDRRQEAEDFEKAPVAVVALASPSVAPPKLPLAYPAGELATAATWPRACESSPTVTSGRSSRRPTTSRAKAASGPTECKCEIGFWLPHKSMPPHQVMPVAELNVTVEGAGDPAVVRAYGWGYDNNPTDGQFAGAQRSRSGVVLPTPAADAQ